MESMNPNDATHQAAPRATLCPPPQNQGAHNSPASIWPHFLTGQPGQPVRVLLVDDDPHIRKVIANELLGDLRTDLVGEGSGVRDGRRLVAQIDFDVILVDLNLADGTGFELIDHVKTMRPMAEAVVISALEDEEHALRAFSLGATGYFVKHSWFGNFADAVLQVANGGASITPSLARRLLGKMQPAREVHRVQSAACSKRLSEREKEVLKMVAAGHTSNEIGIRLGVSSQTVNSHIKNIYRKLHVRTRAQAVSYAAHRGLL